MVLERRERPCTSPVSALISRSQQKLREREKIGRLTPFIEDPTFRTQYAEGFPRQFLQPQDGHPAPARSSQLSLREPPWKKNRPEPQPGGNVSAAQPVAPPCDPRASPDHPTWWVVPPGTHHGQGGEKTAHFGR